MTDFAIGSVAVATGGLTTGMSMLAVMDPSVSNIALAFIGGVVTITTVVFAFKTAKLNALQKQVEAQEFKIAEVKKTSDGMKDELVRVTAKASKAEGVLQEKGDEKVRKAAVAEATALGVAQEKANQKE